MKINDKPSLYEVTFRVRENGLSWPLKVPVAGRNIHEAYERALRALTEPALLISVTEK